MNQMQRAIVNVIPRLPTLLPCHRELPDNLLAYESIFLQATSILELFRGPYWDVRKHTPHRRSISGFRDAASVTVDRGQFSSKRTILTGNLSMPYWPQYFIWPPLTPLLPEQCLCLSVFLEGWIPVELVKGHQKKQKRALESKIFIFQCLSLFWALKAKINMSQSLSL